MTEDVFISLGLALIVGATITFAPLVRAFARRLDRQGTRPPELPADTRERLQRMEQAIDTIAVEVERISEGQRFITKVMSDRPVVVPGSAAGHDEPA